VLQRITISAAELCHQIDSKIENGSLLAAVFFVNRINTGIAMNRTVLALSLTLIASLTFADGVQTLNPESLPVPFKNRFSHAKLVPSEAQWLYTAGQTGRDVDGRIGGGIEEQADFAMRNLYNIVIEAGMSPEDVIKMTIYYLDLQPENVEVDDGLH
jgi:enamine deaminase RidA (YjgF/YER057c/UK114 family)